MNDILGQPWKSGHLCNQDTFGGPQCVRIVQVPLRKLVEVTTVDIRNADSSTGSHTAAYRVLGSLQTANGCIEFVG